MAKQSRFLCSFLTVQRLKTKGTALFVLQTSNLLQKGNLSSRLVGSYVCETTTDQQARNWVYDTIKELDIILFGK